MLGVLVGGVVLLQTCVDVGLEVPVGAVRALRRSEMAPSGITPLCVCVCVCERERERVTGRERVVCACVCVCFIHVRAHGYTGTHKRTPTGHMNTLADADVNADADADADAKADADTDFIHTRELWQDAQASKHLLVLPSVYLKKMRRHLLLLLLLPVLLLCHLHQLQRCLPHLAPTLCRHPQLPDLPLGLLLQTSSLPLPCCCDCCRYWKKIWTSQAREC